MNKPLTASALLIFAFLFFSGNSQCRGEQPEPYAGCLLAAANRREIVRAHSYLNAKIPARILIIHNAERNMNHAALVYCLKPEGWMIYDDAFGSRALRPHMIPNVQFPIAMYAARAAYPTWSINGAWYLDYANLAAR